MKLDLAARAIDRPVTVLMIVLACLFGGLWGLNTVGRLEDPTFTVKTALIFTPYPGATAEDVETEVSEVIESALQQMQQLDYITSKSTPGLSQITVEIKTTYDGSELPQIWDEMRLRLRDLRDQLPAGARDRPSTTISAMSTACSTPSRPRAAAPPSSARSRAPCGAAFCRSRASPRSRSRA